MKKSVYYCNAIEPRKNPIANSLLKFIQAIRLMNCSLSRHFRGSATVSQRIVLLFKPIQEGIILSSKQKKVVEHANVSKAKREQRLKVTTLDLGGGKIKRHGLANEVEKRTRVLGKMNGLISKGVNRLLIASPPTEGYKPYYALN